MLKTPLNSKHHALGGRMVDFAGWEMPVQYSSIVNEHQAVRTAAGLFDISHMGRFRFTGPHAEALLQSALTNDMTRLAEGDVRYSLVCREDGGILDDVLVYRLADAWMLVVNASNRLKIAEHLQQQADFADAGYADETIETVMIALQGPKAEAVLRSMAGVSLPELKYYQCGSGEWNGEPVLFSRTGYTGEDGFELIAGAGNAEDLWNSVANAGEDEGVIAAGLGCRDTLRLEAAMPLYGHELSEQMDPLTAGLKFAVRLKAGDFCGREALQAIADAGPGRVRVGLELEGRRIAREGTPVFAGEAQIGEVTSGTFSPTLEKSVAMAYVPTEYAEAGTSLEVRVRGTGIPAVVVPLPFYKRCS